MRTLVNKFHFDAERACQAVACLLRQAPGARMNYMRLLKLLYLAERKSLADSGAPLTGSAVVAMKRGPVLEDVYSLIRQQHPETPVWSRYFRTDHYELVMERDPGNLKMTPFAVETLNAIAAMHDEHDEFDMVDITHGLEEWIKNDPGESSKPIPLSDILAAVGKADQLDEIVEHARQKAATAAAISKLSRTFSEVPVSV